MKDTALITAVLRDNFGVETTVRAANESSAVFDIDLIETTKLREKQGPASL